MTKTKLMVHAIAAGQERRDEKIEAELFRLVGLVWNERKAGRECELVAVSPEAEPMISTVISAVLSRKSEELLVAEMAVKAAKDNNSLFSLAAMLGQNIAAVRVALENAPVSDKKRALERHEMTIKAVMSLDGSALMLSTYLQTIEDGLQGLTPSQCDIVRRAIYDVGVQCLLVGDCLSNSRQMYGADLDKALNTAKGTANGAKAPQVVGKNEREKKLRQWIKANWKKYPTDSLLFAENAEYIKNEFNTGERNFKQTVRNMRKDGALPKRKKEKSPSKSRSV